MLPESPEGSGSLPGTTLPKASTTARSGAFVRWRLARCLWSPRRLGPDRRHTCPHGPPNQRSDLNGIPSSRSPWAFHRPLPNAHPRRRARYLIAHLARQRGTARKPVRVPSVWQSTNQKLAVAGSPRVAIRFRTSRWRNALPLAVCLINGRIRDYVIHKLAEGMRLVLPV